MRPWFLALLLALLPLHAQAPLPKGEVIPKVVCQADARFSYALYLPRAYHPDRAWPVLFGFSPGGVGEEPVRLFQNAAERFGWIVVGSNDSRNGPMRPALEASAALWKEVGSRFKIDPKRCYSTGFSGGARMALQLALDHPKQFAGIISIGAFGTGSRLLTGLGHLHFYLVGGQEDFNHFELVEGRKELHSRGWKALADRFEGGHRWPPAEVAAQALAFLQMGAARDGLIPPDSALESELRTNLRLAAEQAGHTLLGLRRWQELSRIFPRTEEGRLAEAQATQLVRDPSVKDEAKLEQHYREEALELARTRSDAEYTGLLNRKIALRESASPGERLMIRRYLGLPFSNYRMALSEALLGKQWAQVLGTAQCLTALDEREAWPWIYVGVGLTQLGRPDEALPALAQAERLGYRKPEKIRALAELKPLHGRSDFEALLKRMETSVSSLP